MIDVFGKIGRRGSSLVLAMSLAIGCSSQRAPDSASGGSSGGAAGGAGGDATIDSGAVEDTGFQCGILTFQAPIQPGAAACTILVALPQPLSPDRIKIQDQSMVTIPGPNDGRDYGWRIGDPQAPIILVGSTCTDAMDGKLTALTILVGCVGHPIP